MAIVNKNKNATPRLSRLLMEMPYGVKTARTKAEYSRCYDEIFNGDANAAKCFKESPLQKVSAKSYEVADSKRTRTATGASRLFTALS